MKYTQTTLILHVLFCIFFFVLFINIQPVNASSYNSIVTITIDKNPTTKHMYFAPTYPLCIRYNYVTIKIVNKTSTRAIIQTDRGNFFSVAPHKIAYSYITLNEIPSYQYAIWTLEEQIQYGGNAYAYFTSCY